MDPSAPTILRPRVRSPSKTSVFFNSYLNYDKKRTKNKQIYAGIGPFFKKQGHWQFVRLPITVKLLSAVKQSIFFIWITMCAHVILSQILFLQIKARKLLRTAKHDEVHVLG